MKRRIVVTSIVLGGFAISALLFVGAPPSGEVESDESTIAVPLMSSPALTSSTVVADPDVASPKVGPTPVEASPLFAVGGGSDCTPPIDAASPDLYFDTDTWTEYTAGSVTLRSYEGSPLRSGQAAGEFYEVVVDSPADLLAGDEPGQIIMHESQAEPVRDAVATGTSVLSILIGTHTRLVAEPWAARVVLIDVNGDAFVVGRCTTSYTKSIRRLGDALNLTGRQVLIDHVTGARSLAEAADEVSSAPEPAILVFDPADVAETELANYIQVAIEFTLPEPMMQTGKPSLVCTRSTAGLNECGSFSLGSVIELTAFVPRGETLEVVVIEDELDASEILSLGRVSAERLARFEADDETIRVQIEAQSFGEVRARQGEGMLSIR